MKQEIFIIKKEGIIPNVEFVEYKGKGHPDTLADDLADELSRRYSIYTKGRFGAILHHNFDKLGLLGGASYVRFGNGRLIKPIKVMINGRASIKFNGKIIPINKILNKTINGFFKKRFPRINLKEDLEINYNLSTQSSPGKTNEDPSKKGHRSYWFEPRDLNDLPELKRLFANDTSLGCSYYPNSVGEEVVLKLSKTLESKSYIKNKKWLGSDMKIMLFRNKKKLELTICIPQISRHVKNIECYKKNLEIVKKDIETFMNKRFRSLKVNAININTRDQLDICEIYLTAIGSSIESGDEGLVGRGNRINNLITPCRVMSIEGFAGKNPVYHVGKVYNLAAKKIAKRLHIITKKPVEVLLVSQSGRDLLIPWKTVIFIDGRHNKNQIRKRVIGELYKIPRLTEEFLNKEIS